jgi:hypothetical protein
VRSLSYARFLAVVLAAVPSLHSAPVAPSLTVVLDYELPHLRSSFDAISSELQTIMRGAGLSLKVEDKAALGPNSQFGTLVIFKMSGHCDATPIPMEALSDERGPLAMAYTSDGEILPFGEVKCDRVRRSLQRSLGQGMPSGRDRMAYGSALGKVMAHEIYHMLAHEPHHTKTGLTKEALSSHELLDRGVALPKNALAEIRQYVDRKERATAAPSQENYLLEKR